MWLTEAATRRLAAWHQVRVEFIAAGMARLPAAEHQALVRALPALVVALDAGEQ